MPKCIICQKHFFRKSKLTDGMCEECYNYMRLQRQHEEKLTALVKQINTFEERLADKSRLYDEVLQSLKTQAQIDNENTLALLQEELSSISDRHEKKVSDLLDITQRCEKAEEKLASNERRLSKMQSMYKSMSYAVKFQMGTFSSSDLSVPDDDLSSIAPAPVQALNIKQLRARYRQNEKDIAALLEGYRSHYTTKANAAIYQLMVLALEAELQNILAKLGYGKLETSLDMVKALTSKYYRIASEGNQTIAPTLSKFIGQLEYFYLQAVEIEYEYYVQRERAKEEQRALKEQMRQEAEERRILEQQKKQVEAEEAKYEKEIDRISAQIQEVGDSEEVAKLKAQLEKVQELLNAVSDKKDEIIRLQNGKAGTVYVISNIGSFGDDVFKIGMTRRLEPMDRIKELGDASVPFPFDVHSFIFSEDAVDLENKLHSILNNDRVNKINLRKEFFRVSLDRLQEIVEECDPSAAFNRTALAEQYRQSLSIDVVPDNVDMSALSDDEE